MISESESRIQDKLDERGDARDNAFESDYGDYGYDAENDTSSGPSGVGDWDGYDDDGGGWSW